jgi:ribonuclease HI
MKYYGVHFGRNPETGENVTGAVFDSWDACKPYVIGVPGAKFKSFADRRDAVLFAAGLSENAVEAKNVSAQPSGHPGELRIFVDGSFNPRSDVCGYGVYIEAGSGNRVIYGSLPHSCGGRNIEGEVAGALAALDFLKEYRAHNDFESAVIYHDYEGIGKWADGQWATSKEYTRDYAAVVKAARANGLRVKFSHVDGHTGVTGNEYVDVLAKEGCGVGLTGPERARLNEVMETAKTVVHRDCEALVKDEQPEVEQLSFDSIGGY